MVKITWLCLKLFLILSLARGVPGEGPDCPLPEGIVGLGPIPARILWLILKTDLDSLAVHWQLGILIFPVFGQIFGQTWPQNPSRTTGARPAVPVASKISPADQF